MPFIVKNYNDAMRGAPQLFGVPGGLISVFDAVFLTGFGLSTASAVSVSGGIATATVPSGAPYEVDSVIAVAGAANALVNGEVRVVASSMTSVSWQTTAVDGAVSGTITIKTAPLGWTKVFEGVNKAVYKPSAVEFSGCYLRVDDTGTIRSRVTMYETMSDLDNGTNPAPSVEVAAGAAYWYKSYGSSPSTPVPWDIFGDALGMHYMPAAYSVGYSTGYVGRSDYWFGDSIGLPGAGADNFPCFFTGGVDNEDLGVSLFNKMPQSAGSSFRWWARSYTQVGSAVRGGATSYDIVGSAGGWSGVPAGNAGPYPNSVNNALLLSPVLLTEGAVLANLLWRGYGPGIYVVPQRVAPGTFAARSRVEVSPGIFYKALPSSPSADPSTQGVGFIDHIGPWR